MYIRIYLQNYLLFSPLLQQKNFPADPLPRNQLNGHARKGTLLCSEKVGVGVQQKPHIYM
jgi:hypothetical protein